MSSNKRDLYLRVFGEDKTASKTLDKVAKKAQSTGAKLAGSLGMKIGIAGVGAALAGIASIGMAYEDTLNTFDAVSGATDAQMKAVGETAKRLGNDLTLPATSAAGAALAMTELAKAGLSVQQSMDAAKGTLALAAAAQVDEATAAQIVGAALNAFSLSGSQATKVADLLAGASNAASGEMTDMAQALQQAGTVAAAAGLSVDDTVAAISLLAKRGILGSDAGTSLKTMLMKLQGPSDKAAATLGELGINAYDATGKMLPLRDLVAVFTEKMGALTQEQRDAANTTIFGTDATRAALTVLQGGVDQYDDMTAAVTRSGQALETAGAKTKGVRGAFGALQSTAETLAVDFYEKVAPGAIVVLGALTKLLGGVGPLLDALTGVVSVGAEMVRWAGEHETAVAGLATVYLVSLAPALLTALTRFKMMVALNLGAMFLTAKGGVQGLTGGVRRLTIATAASTAGLAGLAMVAANWFKAWTEGADDAKAAVEDILTDVQFGDERAVQRARRDVEDLGEASGVARWHAMDLGDAFGFLTGKQLRQHRANEQVKKSLEELDRKQRTAITNVRNLSSVLGISEDAVLRLAERAGVDLADGTGAAAKAVWDLGYAAQKGTTPTQQIAAATEVLGDDAATAEEKVAALKDKLDAIFGIALNVSEATDAYRLGLLNLADAAKENGTSLDKNTEKGIANREAFRGLIQDVMNLAQAQADAGAPAEEQMRIFEKGRAELIKFGKEAGFSAEEISALTREVNFVPKSIVLAFEQKGIEPVIAKIDAMRRSVQELVTQAGNLYRVVDGDVLTGGTATRGKNSPKTAPAKPAAAPKAATPIKVPRGYLSTPNSGAALRPAGSLGGAAAGDGQPIVINLDGRHLATVAQRRTQGRISRGLTPAY